jgi:low temperature requirement protein LtrA
VGHKAVQRAQARYENQRMSERRTSPVELLWDLVFVFAVTQLTTLVRWRGAALLPGS